MKFRNALILASVIMAIPALAQDPKPSPAQSVGLFDNMKPVLDGAEKVSLGMGTYTTTNGRASASSYVPLVGIFSGGVIQVETAAGEFSDTKAPKELTRITLSGYSPKTMGMYGGVLLCKAKVDDGNRYIRTKDGVVEKSWYSSVSDVAKLKQSEDGSWAFEIKKPLESGHYLLTFTKSPVAYWDFDVK